MPIDMPVYLELRRKFLANRAAFPVEGLVKYMGQWVAWSPDGSYIAANSREPAELECILRAHGLDPEWCVQEGIPDDEDFVGEFDGGTP